MRSSQRRVKIERLEERRLLASGAGVTAQYFSDTELTSLVATRVENGLVQNWGAGAPVASLNVDQFSARFVGQVEAKYTEIHTFTLAAEGGARLWINGVKIIDRWADASFSATSADMSLVAGRRYDVQLDFRETGGPASVNLQWSSPSLPAQLIPTGSLFPSERGSIERRVWNSVPGSTIGSLTTLATFPSQPSTSTALTSLETTSTGLDQYGQLLIGKLNPTKTGQYRFYIAGDDAAELWLSNSASAAGKQKIAFISSATAPRDWTASPTQQSALVSLVAGQAYAFEVIHKENSGSDHVAVGWTQPGSNAIEVIDGQFLAPPTPTVRVFAKRAEAVEGDLNPLEFVIQRSGTTLTNPLTVSYLLGGTATSGSDYAPKSGSVTIPAGSAVASVLITPLSDNQFEGAENVQLELVDGPGYEVGLTSERQALGTIRNVASRVLGGDPISPAMSLANYEQPFGGDFAELSPVAPFNHILQANITNVPPNPYNAQIRFAYTSVIHKEDVLWAEFYVRSIGGTGRITAVSENKISFEKSLFREVSVGTDWSLVQLPFISVEAYSLGGATFGFYLGAQLQTLQFADISVVNYGRNMEITPQPLSLNESDGEWGFESTVAVSGQPFATATQLTTTAQPPNNEFWHLQYGGKNFSSVRSTDVLLLSFYARSVAGTNPRVSVAIQQSVSPFNTYKFETKPLTSGWQLYSTLVTSLPVDFAAGQLQAMINVGYEPQTVQIADIKWTNIFADVNFSELPSLIPGSISYGGRDAQDAWRSDADQRIADTRQSTLTVNVVDSNGTPVDGAVVSIRQNKQSFLFGSAIDGANNLLSPTGGSDALKYQSEIKRLFNAVTIENSLKWPDFARNRQQGIDVANWVTANGLYLRGHNVIWPNEKYMADGVWKTYTDKVRDEGATAAENYLRSTIQARIQDAVGSFANQAAEWDIVNEPFDNNQVMGALGNQVLIDWYLQARQVDPDVERVLNDYNIFARNGNNTAHRVDFDTWLTQLKAANAIERIGEQSHYSESNLTDIAVLGQLIQLYHSQFSLPIAITEFDVDSTNLQLQADYLRDYMTMTFSQPGVDEFIHWGFTSKAHWKPNSALYNADFSIRPNGQVYEDLVFGNWWTDTRGTTRNGAFVSDVFEGDYTISVTVGDQVVTRIVGGINADRALSISLPGVVFSATQLTGSEGNPTTLTAMLSSAPTTNVVVTLPSTGQVSVSPAQLTFTPANWNVSQTITITPIEDYIAEGPQTAKINATLSSTDRNFNNAITTPLTIQFADGQVLAPPTVERIVLNNGTASRSQITSLLIDFNSQLNHGLLAGAFTVTNIDTGIAVGNVNVFPQDLNGKTSVTLTFSGASTVARQGNGLLGNSLANGNYRLDARADLIRLATGDIPMSANYVFGGQTAAAPNNDRFFRLLGDANGDGVLNGIDLNAIIPSLFNPLGYRTDLDTNGDGVINGIDLNALIPTLFGQGRR